MVTDEQLADGAQGRPARRGSAQVLVEQAP